MGKCLVCTVALFVWTFSTCYENDTKVEDDQRSKYRDTDSYCANSV